MDTKIDVKIDTKKAKSKKVTKKRIIMIAVACILVPVIAYFSYMSYLLFFRSDPTFVSSENTEQGNSALGIPTAEESGIENIVLFGVDNRTPNDHGRTDSIIIATIDKKAKTIKLSSIMRDLYVDIGKNDKQMNRINAAYSLGGPEDAIDALNKNFGLDLKYYAIIDFKAFQEVVDVLGGIDLEVKNYEVNEINKYIEEVNGSKSTLLKQSGFQHLNGQQALSFARIRKVGNGDYERTERQRLVLKCLVEKAKQVDALKIPQLATTLVSYVQTNMPVSKAVELGLSALKFNGGIQNMRIPVDGYYEGQYVGEAAVLVPDIKANAQFLKEFIYNIKATANKDVPAYMQNNFHMDDELAQDGKPIPNIPLLGSKDRPITPDDEDSAHDILPGTGDTGSGDKTETGIGDKTGTGTGDKDENNTGDKDTDNNSGDKDGTGIGGNTDNNSGDNQGTDTATP